MDTEFINLLHELSAKSNNIILDKMDFRRITRFEDYFELEQFLDVNCFGLQLDLINANEKTINIIVKNLEIAINSNCGNNIDLTKYSKENYFTHNYSELNESSESKNDRFSSKEISVFKEMWLFYFVNRLKKILFNIRSILNIDQQFTHHKPDEGKN